MKVILHQSVPTNLTPIIYERDGETVVELAERLGNVGTRGEELECVGSLKVGRIFSFKEE